MNILTRYPRHRLAAFASLVLALLVMPTVGATQDRHAEQLQRLIRTSIESRPDLLAAKHKEDSLDHAVDAARAWPHATLVYGFAALPVETRLGPQRHKVSLTQTIPWPSSLDASERVVATQRQGAVHMREWLERTIAHEVTLAYWNLWQSRALLALLDDETALLKAQLEKATADLALGGDVARVEEISLTFEEFEEQKVDLRAEVKKAEIALAEATGGEQGVVFVDTLPTSATAAPASSEEPHPLPLIPLSAASARREAAAKARTKGLPSLIVGADFVEIGDAMAGHDGSVPQDSGQDALMFRVGLTLPWDRSTYAAAESQQLEVAQEQDSTAKRVVHQVRRLKQEAEVEEKEASRALAVLRGQLLPRAQRVVEAIEQQSTDGVPLERLWRAKRKVFSLRQREVRLLSRLQRARSLAWLHRGALDAAKAQ